MANEEHLEILRQGAKEWNKWREENLFVWPDLRDADLREAVLCHADLHGADLSSARLVGARLVGANLIAAHLSGTHLSRANLSRSDLTGANLNHAQLIRAELSNAQFRGVQLHRANLSGAQLGGARFIHATLIRADLSGADLSHARVGWTTFGNIDLSNTRCLSTILHDGPSTVGIDTLYKSHGKIPDVFLRGCGVPEEMIEYHRSLLGKAIEFYSCFISYSHADKPFARRLHDQLQARGIRCWLDDHDMKPGDRILDVVDDAIRLHDKILLCCSEQSLNSWWVKDEIDKALERERREGRDIIIPLNLDSYVLEGWVSGTATAVRSRLAADFTGWRTDNAKFEEQFERVVKALRTEGREEPPESKL